jgi:hypothetical protein
VGYVGLKKEIQSVEIDPMEPEELANWVNNNLPYFQGEDQRAVGTLAMMVRDYSEFMEMNDTADDLFNIFISMKYKELLDGGLH